MERRLWSDRARSAAARFLSWRGKGKVLTFVTLASEADVQDFERSLGP
jgi:hypothetical protein